MGRPSELVDHYVYKAWDHADRLLYVGCSLNVENRLKEHRSTSIWFPYMTRLTLDGPYPYSVARSIEWELIQTADPIYNGQTPRAIATRRERYRFVGEVMRTAMAQGMPWPEAARHAVIAANFHFDEETAA